LELIGEISLLLDSLFFPYQYEGDDVSIQQWISKYRVQFASQLAPLIHSFEIYNMQGGRYFIAVSLLEAETLRRVIHLSQPHPMQPLHTMRPVVPAQPFPGDCAIALHSQLSGRILDKSSRFIATSNYHRNSAFATFSFIDSQINYSLNQKAMLLRALRNVPPAEREEWFNDVRMCRRRKQTNLASTSVHMIFTLDDEFDLLQTRAVTLRIQTLIRDKGMRARDAFFTFNASNTGVMTCTELNSGLHWLGVELTVDQLHALVRSVDSDHDGLINVEDFKRAFEIVNTDDTDEPEMLASAGDDDQLSRPTIPLRPVKELHTDIPETDVPQTVEVELTEEIIKAIKVKVHRQEKFNKVWTSVGTMTRTSVSVWAPDVDLGMFRNNKERICLGFVASEGFQNPGGNKKLVITTIEVTDTTNMKVVHSRHLETVMNRLLPYPLRFRQVCLDATFCDAFFASL
jgi:hypothetical protein